MNPKKAAVYRLGVNTFLILMVLTLVEFAFGSESFSQQLGFEQPSAVLLIILALVKAALIVNNFMHITRLWREEGH